MVVGDCKGKSKGLGKGKSSDKGKVNVKGSDRGKGSGKGGRRGKDKGKGKARATKGKGSMGTALGKSWKAKAAPPVKEAAMMTMGSETIVNITGAVTSRATMVTTSKAAAPVKEAAMNTILTTKAAAPIKEACGNHHVATGTKHDTDTTPSTSTTTSTTTVLLNMMASLQQVQRDQLEEQLEKRVAAARQMLTEALIGCSSQERSSRSATPLQSCRRHWIVRWHCNLPLPPHVPLGLKTVHCRRHWIGR